MKTINIQVTLPGRNFWVGVVAVFLSVFMVSMAVYGASMMNTSSVGAGTSTPNYAVGAKGAGVFEGFVAANYFTSTSSLDSWLMGGLGLGTTTVSNALNADGSLAVHGSAIIGDTLTVSTIKSTSTTDVIFGGAIQEREAATSTFIGGITAGTGGLTSTGGLRVDTGQAYFDEFVGVGTTSPTSSLTVGVGTASTTVYVSGGPAVGSELILKSSNGEGCVAITVRRGSVPIGGSGSLETLVSAKVRACPN